MIDAVLIPGGGLSEAGGLPPYVVARLDLALRHTARFYITLSAATPHRPLRPRFESAAAAEYLCKRGIPAAQILTETSSYDTIGNAWFARLLHAEPRGLRKLLVINSEFHIARTEAVFRWVFGATPTPGFELSFESAVDAGVSADGLAARRAKERRSLESIHALAGRITTLAELHAWMYGEHEAYAWPLRERAFVAAEGPLLETY